MANPLLLNGIHPDETDTSDTKPKKKITQIL